MNRTNMDLVRSMLHSSDLSKEFWGEAVPTAVYIRNRVPSNSLPTGETPQHRWIGMSLDLSHIRVFGCKCWFVIPKVHMNKLGHSSKPCIMIGCSTQSKGYKILDTESRALIVSRDVQFEELSVGLHTTISDEEIEAQDSVHVQGGEFPEEIPEDTDFLNPSTEPEMGDSSQDKSQDNNTESASGLRRSKRFRKPTREWWKETGHYAQALSAQIVPISYRTATSPENLDFWMPGIEREHNCITQNETWSFVEREPGMQVVP